MTQEINIIEKYKPKNKIEMRRYLRKKKILDVTKNLVLERGINNEIMSEIAKRSEISRQQLYKYYNNIEDILHNITFSIIAESQLFYLSDISDADNDPVATIRKTILSLPNISDELRKDLLFMALYNVYYSTHTNNNKSSLNTGLFPFKNQIETGQNLGIFRTDKTVEELSVTVTDMIAAFSFYAVMNGHKKNPLYQEDALNAISDSITNYLTRN